MTDAIAIHTTREGSGSSPPTGSTVFEQTIPGLEQCMCQMKEGQCANVVCRPEVCYGDYGNPQGFHSMGNPIPPKATLHFQLEFLYFDQPSKDAKSMTNHERIEYARQKKEEGNAIFKEGHFLRAWRRYFKGGEYLEDMEAEGEEDKTRKELLIACYLNAAACKLKLEQDNYKDVVECTTKVLELEPNNVKALFRRAKGNSLMGEDEKAKEDLVHLLEIDKNNNEAKQELSKVQAKLSGANAKAKQFYGGMFGKLSDTGLYADAQPQPEPKTKLCTICNEEVETIQWARHVIKKHGSK